MSAFDKLETVAVLAVVGIGAYLAWKAYKGAQAIANAVPVPVTNVLTNKGTGSGPGGTFAPGDPTNPDYSIGGALYRLGQMGYQAGLKLSDSIGGMISDGKTFDDMTGYVLPSTVYSSWHDNFGTDAEILIAD